MSADLIFDATGLFARSWFAAVRACENDLAMASEKTAQLCIQTVLLLLEPDSQKIGCRVDRTLFCWDGFRNPLKKRTTERPKEYHDTKQYVRELFTYLFGSAHAEDTEHEADDLVASAAVQSSADDVYVVSGDKDVTQIVGGRIQYYCLNEKALLPEHFIVRKWRVHKPEEVAIALAIIGDKTDAIAGVPKWGIKRVQQLFAGLPPDESFACKIDTIANQVPENIRHHFWESLERTLLNTELTVTEPAPLVWCTEPEAHTVTGNIDLYPRVCRKYARVPARAAASGDDVEDL